MRECGKHDDSNFTEASCAVVMFDLTSKQSYHKARDWISRLRDENPEIRIVLCGNKVDKIKGDKSGEDDILEGMRYKDLNLHRELHLLKYWSVSAKSWFNLDKILFSFI